MNRRSDFGSGVSGGGRRFPAVVICLSLGAMLLSGCAADRMYRRGAEAEAKGDYDTAVLKYQEALKKDPENLEYRIQLEKAKTSAAKNYYEKGEQLLNENKYSEAEAAFQMAVLMDSTFRKAEHAVRQVRRIMESEIYYRKGVEHLEAKRTADARTAFRKALSLNPKNEAAKTALEKTKETKTMLDGYELSLKSTKPITLKFKDTGIKEVFEIVSKLSGINFIFDEDLKDQKVSIFMQDATFEQAMELLLLTNKLMAKAVTENTIIIIPKTPAKVKQYQDLMIHTFYLSHIDAKKAVNLLRALLQLKQVHVNEELNTVIVRDEPERIRLAKKVIEANDIPDAEIMLEVEIIEVTRDKLSDMGLNLSTSSISGGIYSADAVTSSESGFATSMTYGNLKGLSTDTNLLLSPLPQLVFNFKKTQSGSKTLANPKIRVVNNGKAKIHIGDRIPIVTSTLLSTGQSQTNVQYQDVGVKLNAEPKIHLEQDVTIKLSLEVSSVGTPLTDPDTGLVVAYQIGTRSAETVLNLKDGETQVIGGLIRDEERTTKTSIPFLGEIPVIGRLFSSNSNQNTKSDILLAITPHVVRGLEIPSEEVTTFWSGKEDDFTLRQPFESFKEKEEAPSSDLKIGTGTTISAAPVSGAAPPPPGAATQPAPAGEKGTGTTEEAKIESKAAAGSLYISAPAVARVGQEVQVSVAVKDINNIYGASINLSYNSSLLEFVRTSEGSFLKQDGKSTSFMQAFNAAEGRVTAGITRLGAAGGVGGSGTLFTVTFKPIAEGTASVLFQEGTLKDPALAVVPTSGAFGADIKIVR